MAQFVWTDALCTGSAFIDGDHRTLVGLVNSLFEALEGARGNEAMRKAMQDLVNYTEEHFGREEAEMARIQYVAALAHETEHRRLLQQLAGLKQLLDSGGMLNVPALADFLREWLHEHILSADMKLAATLKLPRNAATATPAH